MLVMYYYLSIRPIRPVSPCAACTSDWHGGGAVAPGLRIATVASCLHLVHLDHHLLDWHDRNERVDGVACFLSAGHLGH